MTHGVLHRARRCGHTRRNDVLTLVRSYVADAPAPADGAREAAWGRLEALFEREARRRAPGRRDALVRGARPDPPKDVGPPSRRWSRTLRHAVTALTAAAAFAAGAGIGWLVRSPLAATPRPGAGPGAPTLAAAPGPALVRAAGGQLAVPASWARVGPCPHPTAAAATAAAATGAAATTAATSSAAPELAELATLPEALRCARAAAGGATVVWLVADTGAPPPHSRRGLLHGLVADRVVRRGVHELVVPSLGVAVVWVGPPPTALLATLRAAAPASSPPHFRLSRSQIV